MEKLEITSMSSRGQVVITLEVREQLGLKEGEKFFVVGEDDTIILKKVTMPSFKNFDKLIQKTQQIAKAYDAACTPDFYIFDGGLKLIYRGQMDDSRPGNGKAVTGLDIRKALDQILGGTTVSEDQIPSIGCNIKWK